MKDLIFFIKNIFNPYRFEFSLAFANSFYPEFTKKELDFIMYAKIEKASNIFDNEDTQLINTETKNKYTFMDRLRGIFSGRKGLPDPNKEYTMDDWINAQKNPVSRLLNNIAHKTASVVKSALNRREAEKNKNINIPSTPSQNFEMSQTTTARQDKVDIVIPVEKNVQNVKKPFVPLKVETINIDDKGLEEAKAELIQKGESSSEITNNKKPKIAPVNIDFDSKGLEEAELSVSNENKDSKSPVSNPTKTSNEEIELE